MYAVYTVLAVQTTWHFFCYHGTSFMPDSLCACVPMCFPCDWHTWLLFQFARQCIVTPIFLLAASVTWGQALT
ncbi:cytokinin-N-glucosyltransferase 1 [Corchorus olitorius]|uniref:Cytokinin-N-glucosyltransferase 1 n=1 Tax=Corchorus olitorius TaxID=93759 RepID=A0A1R3JJI8_9ROSI|nr:cytokinin-N-glucosyltransferase 1 [Corchorus olitorius]